MAFLELVPLRDVEKPKKKGKHSHLILPFFLRRKRYANVEGRLINIIVFVAVGRG